MPLIPNKLIVEVDTREHYPIPFPTTLFIANRWTDFKRVAIPVETIPVRLYYGDYRLQDYPTCAVVERKASFAELAQNLFDPTDVLRCCRAFGRLRDQCSHPYLLIEMSLHEFFRAGPPSPEELLHRLYLSAAHFGFSLLWVPRTSDRRLLGTTLLHLMLAHALQDSRKEEEAERQSAEKLANSENHGLQNAPSPVHQ